MLLNVNHLGRAHCFYPIAAQKRALEMEPFCGLWLVGVDGVFYSEVSGWQSRRQKTALLQPTPSLVMDSSIRFPYLCPHFFSYAHT
jgi:hypothetical protein